MHGLLPVASAGIVRVRCATPWAEIVFSIRWIAQSFYPFCPNAPHRAAEGPSHVAIFVYSSVLTDRDIILLAASQDTWSQVANIRRHGGRRLGSARDLVLARLRESKLSHPAVGAASAAHGI